MSDFLTAIVTVIGIFLLVAILMGLPLMLLWNWLMPQLFNLPEIGFWQAVGLNFMCSIMFKGTSPSKTE
jgi:hypothetical protein